MPKPKIESYHTHFISVTQTTETTVGKESMERDKLDNICKELDKNNTAATDQRHRIM